MNNALIAILKNHPALLLSGCYFLITSIGVVYSFLFYREFGVNILNFSDMGDFLLASILTPVSILIFFGTVVLVILLSKLDQVSRRRIPLYGKMMEKFLKPKYSDPITHFLTVLITAGVYIKALAQADAEKVKAGEHIEYRVRYLDTSGTGPEKSLAFLGGSTRYNYFYDPTTKQIRIIPISNILEMVR